ncbi:hypothetical protein DL765_003453 [Monosporascus sp. GIB2]|nr:hypothetical protein DL765_003453 [Monosporascus sp. GIB2]
MKVAVLSFLHHHIAPDGQSFSSFLPDLSQVYSGQMPTTPVQQAIDMAKKQSATYSKESLEQELAFWGEIYRTPPPEPLPFFPFSKIKTRQALKSYNMHTVDIKLDINFTKLIKQATAGLQVTSFSFYLSTLADQARELATEATLVLNLDSLSSSADNIYESVENVSERSQPAALFYTSGSTGVPKGVILNQVYDNVTQFGIGREVMLQNSSLGFDLILQQTFHALAMGGTLVMASKESRGNPTQLVELMLSQGVIFAHIVSSEYLPLLHYSSQTLRKTSESLPVNLEGLELINAYGPLEATLACARGIVLYRTDDNILARNDSLRPSPNYSISTMDEHMNPVSVGFPGKAVRNNGRRFTRSGDRGRLLPYSSLEILGRLEGDSQVKLRGIRIELDEIANVIVQAPSGAIVNAAVSLRQGSDVLAAFVVYDTDFRGDRTEIAEWLKRNLPLPPYMRPVFMVATERLPMTANRKKGRKAVDYMPISNEQSTVEASDKLTAMEQSVKKAWQEGTFGAVLSLPELFQASTLRSMAARVAKTHEVTPVQQVDWNVEFAAFVRGLAQPGGRYNRQRIVKTSRAPDWSNRVPWEHILKRLIEDDRIIEVYCITIRPDALGHPRHIGVKSKKVIGYSEDLSDRFLGLTESEFGFLAENINLIIHNGAKISFLKAYSSLRRANIVSTRTLCEMGIPRSAPFHFVSTGSASKFTDKATLP